MKQSLYLETSVVGAYLDNGEPFRVYRDSAMYSIIDSEWPAVKARLASSLYSGG